MEAARRAGFNGPIGELRGWIRENPANYPFATADEVIAYLYRIHARIVPQLPRLFGRMPKAPFEIRLTEPELAAHRARAMASAVGRRDAPGRVHDSRRDPRNAATFDLAALLAHEGMPGHHFDGGIRLENKVPDFRRRLWVNAFGEGWGLYAECSATISVSTRSRSRSWAATPSSCFAPCRLVVDTGLHAKGGRGSAPSATSSRNAARPKARRDCRSAALHGLAGPGARLQDRRAHDPRACAPTPRSAWGRASTCARSTTPSSRRATCRSSMARERMEAWIEEQARK